MGREADSSLWDEMRTKDPEVSWGNLDREHPAFVARDKIATHYQFLVEALARKLKVSLPTFISDEDLISYGQLGLLKAMDRYNPETGPFSRYASAVVYGAILDELRGLDWAPRGLRKDQRDLERVLSQGATDLEAAMSLGWSVEQVTEVKNRVSRAELKTYDDMTTSDGIHSDDASFLNVVSQELIDWVDTSFKGHCDIIYLRYYESMTVPEIAQTLDISATIVREVHRRFLMEVLPFVERLLLT